MSRVWFWTENYAEYDSDPESPNYGNQLRVHFYALAGQPRFPGDPTDLTNVECTEENGAQNAFRLNGVQYASQAALVAAYNETVLERLHLNAEPNG